MKKLIVLLALCYGTLAANAQITTGESTSKVIRTGNRAQAGNFGLYLGATTDMFNKLFDKKVEFSALPLINLKYMATDKLEARLGLEWWKTSESVSQSSDGNDYDGKESEKSYTLYPGIAYHFNNRNLLDVYVGGEIPFGFGNKGTDDDGDDYYQSFFRIGLGAFIGLQAYIANLPIALGLEYGISLQNVSVTDGSLEKDGYVIEMSNQYKKDYDTNYFKIGNQARLTFTYYFNL